VFVDFGSLAKCIADLLVPLMVRLHEDDPVHAPPDEKQLRRQWPKEAPGIINKRPRFTAPDGTETMRESRGFLLGEGALASPTLAEDLSAAMRESIVPVKQGEHESHSMTACLLFAAMMLPWFSAITAVHCCKTRTSCGVQQQVIEPCPVAGVEKQLTAPPLSPAHRRWPVDAAGHARAGAHGVHQTRAGGR
jgi:hypothetical protein